MSRKPVSDADLQELRDQGFSCREIAEKVNLGKSSINQRLKAKNGVSNGQKLSPLNRGGRKLGSRQLLATKFSDDLYAKWEKHGDKVLDVIAVDEPAKFATIVAQHVPKQVDMEMTVSHELGIEAKDFLQAYRTAREYIGAKDEPLLIEGEVIEIEAVNE